MEINDYVLEMLVQEKLQAARAATARRALVVGSRPPRAALRARVGAALIALGQRLAGTPAPRAGTPAPRRSCATPGRQPWVTRASPDRPTRLSEYVEERPGCAGA